MAEPLTIKFSSTSVCAWANAIAVGVVASEGLATYPESARASFGHNPMRRLGDVWDVAQGVVYLAAPSAAFVTGTTLEVTGGALQGIDYHVPMASAQVATCTLLAGLSAAGATRVTLPGPARDHTERMLPAFGVPLEVHPLASGGRRVTVIGGARLVGTEVALRIRRVDGEQRHVHGVVARLSAGPLSMRRFRTYRLEVVPWLWLLSHSSDCRIFRNSCGDAASSRSPLPGSRSPPGPPSHRPCPWSSRWRPPSRWACSSPRCWCPGASSSRSSWS